jgi:hypothetical protein
LANLSPTITDRRPAARVKNAADCDLLFRGATSEVESFLGRVVPFKHVPSK